MLQGVSSMNMELSFSDFSRYNSWIQKDKEWKRYKNHSSATSIPRLAFAHIKSKERYYLRCLLLEKKGCYSFDDIRTHDDKKYRTFHETADAMRLLNDDEELFKYMR